MSSSNRIPDTPGGLVESQVSTDASGVAFTNEPDEVFYARTHTLETIPAEYDETSPPDVAGEAAAES